MVRCQACGHDNPETNKFCGECAAPLTGTDPGSEARKTVTIVFCDVVGSTAIGGALDPESLRRVMERFFDAMRAAIEHHGGTVEKFIGDAVMAVFGVPHVHEDDALRAIRSAVEMRERLAELNKDLERDRGVRLAIRTGVMTGEVVAGDPSAGQRLVTGDAVNTAARLEQAAKPGEILIGMDTFRLVRDVVSTEPIEALELKGKAERVPAHRVLAITSSVSGQVRRLDSPLVGRDRELGSLKQGFSRAVADRACQLFTVFGLAGVGKSRLVAEFLSRTEVAHVFRGRCLAYGEGITYFPVIEVVKQAAGLSDFDDPEVVEAKVCAVLAGEEQQQVICRLVSQLLGIAELASPDETFWAIRRMLEAIAHDRPLVIVFDDIHWGEPTFLDLIEHIADWSRDAPILLLCMARPDLLDIRPSWGGGKMNASTISLEPLNPTECDVLARNLLGTTKIEEGIGRLVTEAAEGNPLFVEEVLSMLIDDGLLVQQDGRWVQSGDLSQVNVPPSISALLSARLDRLPPEEHDVLERASVVGKVFFRTSMHAMSSMDPSIVDRHLMSLVRKEFIRPDRSILSGEDAFRFRHLLIRDAAYESVPKETRAEMHTRFAYWLEQVAGGRVEEQEEILGYHLETAYRCRMDLGIQDADSIRLAVLAGHHLANAGDRALSRGDPSAAANLLARAHSMLPIEDLRRAGVLIALGTAQWGMGDLEEARLSVTEAIEAAKEARDVGVELLALLLESQLDIELEPEGKTELARMRSLKAIQIFEELGDEQGVARAWLLLSTVHNMWSQEGERQKAAEEAIKHSLRSDGPTIGYTDLAAAMYLGPATVSEGIQRCEAMLEETGLGAATRANIIQLLGGFEGMRGRFDRSRTLFAQARSINDDLGIARPPAGGELPGSVEMLAGDLVAAEREYRTAYEGYMTGGYMSSGSTLAALLADALCHQARYEEAQELLDIGREFGASDDVANEVILLDTQAKILAKDGRLAEAEEMTREALSLVPLDSLNFRAGVLLRLADVIRLAGRPNEAIPIIEEARDLFEQKGNVVAASKANVALQELGGR